MKIYKKNRKTNAITELLILARIRDNIKAADLAKIIGVNVTHYLLIESGKKIPHLNNFLRIAELIEIPQEKIQEILLKYYKKQLRINIRNNICIKQISDSNLLKIYELLADAEPIEKEEADNE